MYIRLLLIIFGIYIETNPYPVYHIFFFMKIISLPMQVPIMNPKLVKLNH